MAEEKSRFEIGLEVYRIHEGRDYTPAKVSNEPPAMAEFNRISIEHTYGDSWSRTGLDMKTKNFVSITVQTTLGVTDQIRNHIRRAHNIGITRDEIAELAIHLAAYIGVPRTGAMAAIAREVWAEIDAGK